MRDREQLLDARCNQWSSSRHLLFAYPSSPLDPPTKANLYLSMSPSMSTTRWLTFICSSSKYTCLKLGWLALWEWPVLHWGDAELKQWGQQCPCNKTTVNGPITFNCWPKDDLRVILKCLHYDYWCAVLSFMVLSYFGRRNISLVSCLHFTWHYVITICHLDNTCRF